MSQRGRVGLSIFVGVIIFHDCVGYGISIWWVCFAYSGRLLSWVKNLVLCVDWSVCVCGILAICQVSL